MLRILTGLFALILVAGLLVACQNPSAAPSTPAEPPATEEPTTTPDPDPDPEPMVTELDLTWGGWDRAGTATSGSFDWPITLEGTQQDEGGTPNDLKAQLAFTKDHRGVVVTLENEDSSAALCGLGATTTMVAEISGTSISFSGDATEACTGDTAAFGAFDSSQDKSDASNGVAVGDTFEVELTLSRLPDLTPMLDAEPQKISFSGTVTIEHEAPEDSTTSEDTTTVFDFTGTATYNTPSIQPASN